MPATVPEPNLMALAELLSGQALLAMGFSHPGLKDPPPADPLLARFFVDLLEILKNKTEGNRNDGESRQIDELLYHLRMKVLELQSPESGGRPKPTGA